MQRKLLLAGIVFMLIIASLLLITVPNAPASAHNGMQLASPTPDTSTVVKDANDALSHAQRLDGLVHIRIGYNTGASIIINETLYPGADNLAGAFGHMIVDPNGPECSCGNRGCLDTIVSRAAIERELLQRHREGKATILARELNKEPLDINSAVIAEAIDQEDLLTHQVVVEAAEVLGIGIANVINFLNPHRVILGGDVIDEVDLFFERAVESAREKTLHANMRNVSIVR